MKIVLNNNTIDWWYPKQLLSLLFEFYTRDKWSSTIARENGGDWQWDHLEWASHLLSVLGDATIYYVSIDNHSIVGRLDWDWTGD